MGIEFSNYFWKIFKSLSREGYGISEVGSDPVAIAIVNQMQECEKANALLQKELMLRLDENRGVKKDDTKVHAYLTPLRRSPRVLFMIDDASFIHPKGES